MGYGKQTSETDMPHLIFTPTSLDDLDRVDRFLESKNPAAASKARQLIFDRLSSLPTMPMAHRPVPRRLNQRDLIIPFGASGYIVRFGYEPGGDITILRMWHQKESGFEDL